MESSRTLCLLLAIAATLFETGFCIRCYQCSSRKDSNCADPISSEAKVSECTRDSVTSTLNEINYVIRPSTGINDVYSGNMFICLKITSMNSNNYNNNVTVVRGCYYDKVDGGDTCAMLKSKVVQDKSLQFCETCNGDNCNGSNKLSSTVSMTSMLLPLIAVYYFLRQ